MSEDLANYIERSKQAMDTFSDLSESDVEMKFIQPLLDLLGWDRFNDVRTQYSVRAGTTYLKIDYALFVDDEPDVIVEAKSGAHSLTEEDREQLRSYMRQTETDWGLLTNGKQFHVLSLTGAPSSAEGPLFETTIGNLGSDWENLRILSKEMIESGQSYELEKELNTRSQGIKKLEENANSIKKDMAEILIEKTNNSLASDIEEEVDSFIDDLIQNLSTDPADENLPRAPEDVLETLGTYLPGRTEEVREERAEYILTAYNFLRSKEKAKGQEIKDHVVKTTSNSLSSEDLDRQWQNYLRDNLSELPRIHDTGGGTKGVWRYVSPELEEEVMVDEIDDWVKNLDDQPVGSGKAVEMQQAMIQHAYNSIREEGTVTKENLIDSLPDYTAHYTNYDGLWIYCIRDTLHTCEDIESPSGGNKYWRYIGDEEIPSELDIEIEEWVENANISGEKMTKKERQALLQYAYNYLKEVGEAQRGDFREHFRKKFPEKTGRYNTFDSLWSYLLSEELDSAPGVQTHQSGKVNPIIYSYSG
ncbi:type I restriction enzyme HsdR N-terminal domain-containing protein [Natronococcus amylolyticus]|uniref:type I restriction enzyme HsdR N-terminal domain-containing protein n=1 Tax=Natronococcus amylolyticus TaxID=44470 RepID=UPI000A05921E|nr:type I restriction enzyme HsdR N-terminal domain-containing protein [Natronococcus amylolyticus]